QLENIVLELFNNKSLGVTSMDVDDKNQVYEIGLEKLDDSKKDLINKFLAMHDIPQDMIKLKETGKIIPVGGGTGSTYTPGPTIRPIEGGLQIGVSPSFGSCTIGFIAKTSSGSTVGTTAGHCVDGGRTNAANQKYTQPYSSNANDYTTNAIASVIASSDKAPPRYSDTLLFTPSVSTNLGKIYNGGPVLTVTGKDYSPYVGKAVSAFGSTSGTGSGTITKTGVVYSDSALGGLVYGQVEASMSPIPYPNPGDSGGPVWSTNPDSTITLEGTMVARSIDNSQVVLIFSPISGIEFDQGTLQVN
ncbi:MAG: hypothetical protein KGL95_04060, partial [Patescibacteria group bacterium]|nr:hypothetical protein [Patescibacteria group bacterium]